MRLLRPTFAAGKLTTFAPDLPLTTKATNVLNYTKDMVSPILVQIKELIVKVKVEAESAAPAPNGSS